MAAWSWPTASPAGRSSSSSPGGSARPGSAPGRGLIAERLDAIDVREPFVVAAVPVRPARRGHRDRGQARRRCGRSVDRHPDRSADARGARGVRAGPTACAATRPRSARRRCARRPPTGSRAGSGVTRRSRRPRSAACVGTKEFVASLPQYLRLRDPSRDTILYPAISYPTYEMGATLGGCRAVPYRDLDDISDADAARALAVWVNSPSNPTGDAVRPRRGRRAGGASASVLVVSDECYVDYTWTGAPTTILADGPSGVLAVHSLSKRDNFAGARVGFYAGDRRAGPLPARGPQARRADGRRARPGRGRGRPRATTRTSRSSATRYFNRLKALIELLGGAGYPAQLPDGAFYLWVPAPDGDAWAAAYDLAERAGIVVSPGDFYGHVSAGYFRVAAVQPDDRIALAAASAASSADEGVPRPRRIRRDRGTSHRSIQNRHMISKMAAELFESYPTGQAWDEMIDSTGSVRETMRGMHDVAARSPASASCGPASTPWPGATSTRASPSTSAARSGRSRSTSCRASSTSRAGSRSRRASGSGSRRSRPSWPTSTDAAQVITDGVVPRSVITSSKHFHRAALRHRAAERGAGARRRHRPDPRRAGRLPGARGQRPGAVGRQLRAGQPQRDAPAVVADPVAAAAAAGVALPAAAAGGAAPRGAAGRRRPVRRRADARASTTAPTSSTPGWPGRWGSSWSRGAT